MADEPAPFIITDATNKSLELRLVDFDLPHGRARREAAFELGGEVNADEVWLDGRSDPVIHVHQPRNRPLVIKGHFRDHLVGVEGHALDMAKAAEDFKFRCREVLLTWDRLRWRAFLRETKYGLEDISNITFELTFTVIEGPLGAQAFKPVEHRESPGDDTNLALARARELRAKMDRESMQDLIVANIHAVLDAVDTALSSTVIEAQRFEEVAVSRPTQPRNLIARCQETQARLADMVSVVSVNQLTGDPLDAELEVLERVTASSLYRWWAFRDDVVYAATEIGDVMRQVQATARRRMQKADRLYLVKTGDTLESIAMARLGSPGRAGDLGIQSQALLPGRFIRIPEAP